MRREFSVGWGEFFIGNFTLEELARIPMRNPFYLSCFFFVDSILRIDMLKKIVWGKFFTGIELTRESLLGGGGVSLEVKTDFLPLFQRPPKMKLERSFFL